MQLNQFASLPFKLGGLFASALMVPSWCALINLLNYMVDNFKLMSWVVDKCEQIGLLVANCTQTNRSVIKYVLQGVSLRHTAVLDVFQLNILGALCKWRGLDIGNDSFICDDEGIATIYFGPYGADKQSCGNCSDK